MTSMVDRHGLTILKELVSSCASCRLSTTRTNTVFERGDPASPLHFIGEAPGETEDQTGVPFVGQSGVLLDAMMKEAGIDPRKVYVYNVIRCRPPKNRPPFDDELAACAGNLCTQLLLTDPSVIVLLGRTAMSAFDLAEVEVGKFCGIKGVTVMPTFHPAYVLRSPDKRAMVVNHLERAAGVAGAYVRRNP